MGDDVNRKVEKVGVPSNHYTSSRIFSIEELPMALGYSVLNNGDFKNSIIDGINSGRDTDSIGVMIGTILGALRGMNIFNKEEINILNNANKIDFTGISNRFAATALDMIMEDQKQMEMSIQNLKKLL